MIKWAIDWDHVLTQQGVIKQNGNNVWAVNMPKSYPECRVTRQGIAHIAVTDDEVLVEELRQDGGDVKLLP